ncbi:PIN domain-containing protein [Capnocytophaga sp. oral taxon 878]|uniref:PIN domain-containing protein n=1 Tax=Capnocytophaga sp. oral taxon 878 TaxID=1316596 RepID=UPI000D02AF91|nr:PIN domain-containing protein [Capnocytophaga sp. oral taxon 878]AVM49301.1 PIN domain nuclease [Capnocytophaga sp. oral taxon 878]
MIVIADSNIFFGSLIAPNGELASILKDKNMQFMAPDYIIEEVKDHLDTIKKKRKKDKTNRQILADLALLLKNITVVPLEDLSNKNIQKAFSIVKDIDEDDYPFIAMHLQYKHKIWSRDEDLIEGLTQKGYGHFFTSTEELKKHLYKKKK